jgi:hypothetical protein
MKYKPRTIEVSKIVPHLEELVHRCGDLEKTARYCGIGKTTLHRVINRENRTVRMATAQLIMDALVRRREEDRVNYSTNHKLAEARKRQAWLEDNQERLTGY